MANQTTAVIALWVGTMYLALAKKHYLVAALPATFMTYNVFVYILSQPIGFGMDLTFSYYIAILLTAIVIFTFVIQYRKMSGYTTFDLDHPVILKKDYVG